MHLLKLREPLPCHLAPELSQRIFFVSDDIRAFELCVDQGLITGVRVETADRDLDSAVLAGELTVKLNAVVEDEVRGLRRWTPRVAWASPDAVEDLVEVESQPLLERLCSEGRAYAPGPGTVALGSDLLRLLDHVDARLREFTLGLPRSVEFRYPTLIPLDALERTGYFSFFPHLVMFVSRLHNDYETYRVFRERLAGSGTSVGDASGGLTRADGYCLPPTMCYHVYDHLQGTALDCSESVQVHTAVGKCFRYESRYEADLERLWDFTIREVVFLGTEDNVATALQQFTAGAREVFASLGIPVLCQVANDPFFGALASEKVLGQRVLSLKHEVVARVSGGRTSAIASFNRHGRHFGTAFGITQELTGEPVSTACAGFGLERVVHAFLSRHGTDSAGWPDEVRRAVVA